VASKSTKAVTAARKAKDMMTSCRLCAHGCGVDREKNEKGKCLSGAEMEVASCLLHFGEEPFISAAKGSGAIFFSHCNLHCAYCQNYQISHMGIGSELCPAELSREMLALQAKGAHNINLVTPTHYIPGILESLATAFESGLNIPIVYNTNGYDSPQTIDLLDGVVDIYLPDFKYGVDSVASKYSQCDKYVENTTKSIGAMFAQTGGLTVDASGVAKRGTIVRHLVLPGHHKNTATVLKILANISREITLSLMSQYQPAFRSGLFPEISETLSKEEYSLAIGLARQAGFRNILVQPLASAGNYVPDFGNKQPFV